MTLKERIITSVFAVVDDTNAELPDNMRLARSPETVLFGPKGKLDSLGLVNFIVAVEQRIEEDFGRAISLADEKAMSQRHSPFRTLQTLIDYVATLLEDAAHG